MSETRLTELVERAVKATVEHDSATRTVKELWGEVQATRAERDRLREALTFYADPSTYEPLVEPSLPVNDLLRDHMEPPEAMIDLGEKARSALKREAVEAPECRHEKSCGDGWEERGA